MGQLPPQVPGEAVWIPSDPVPDDSDPIPSDSAAVDSGWWDDAFWQLLFSALDRSEVISWNVAQREGKLERKGEIQVTRERVTGVYVEVLEGDNKATDFWFCA